MRKLILFFLLLLSAWTVNAQQTSTFTPNCSGVAATDTTAISNLITLITTSSRTGTLKIPYTTTRCAVNNLTIPAGVTLDFASNSVGISITTGQTLTIVGPVLSPSKKVFFNATAGLGTVSFSGNKVVKVSDPHWWGALGDNSTDNTPPGQAAITAMGTAGGGTVPFEGSGIYLLNTQGTDPYYAAHKYCLNINADNVHVALGSGVTLKLANSQQTDAGGAVNIIIFRSRSGLTISGASDGSSIITGNTAGQTGWTGGYAQIANGMIISGYGTSAGAANSDIVIRDLWLKDHFSNPINIQANSATDRNVRIRIERVHSTDCGEGPQIVTANDVWIIDCLVDSPNHVAMADGIEISDVTRFYLIGNTVRNHRAASAFDIFGCVDGVIDSWVSDDNDTAVNIHAFGGVPDPKKTVVSNGIVINPRDTTGTGVCDGINLNADNLDNIVIKNIVMKGTAYSYGFQILANSALKGGSTGLLIEDCVIDGGIDGILLVAAFPNMTIRGGSYSNMSNRGIVFAYGGNGILAADLENLIIEGVKAEGNGGYGISIDNQGFTVPAISGVIQNCYLENNVSGAINVASATMISGLTINNLTPNAVSGAGGGTGVVVVGATFVSPTGSDAVTFSRPSKNQQIIIVPSETRAIIDRRQAGGNNIDLLGGLSFTMAVGDRLVLQYNNTASKWYEVARSTNGTTIAGVFTSVTDSGLTAGRVTFAGTGGLLSDDSDLTFATDTLTATKFAGALNGTVGATTPAAGTFTTATANTSLVINGGTALTTTNRTGTGNLVLATSPTFLTDLNSPLYRSTSAKVLLQGTGTGATQISSTQTTPPTCSSNCGTSPSIAGSDSDMRVTMGGTGSPASGFVVTFNGTWAAAPVCTTAMATTGMVVGKLPLTVVTTTTTITIVTNGTAPGNSDTYAIMCRGLQ